MAGKVQNVAKLVVWRGFATKADMKKTGIVSMGLSRISITTDLFIRTAVRAVSRPI